MPIAIAVRIANTTASTRPVERVSGMIAMTTATAVHEIATRSAIHPMWPMTMSTASSGVAAIARYDRSHLKPASTGHEDSIVATTIAVVASRPGAMKATYETPPSSCSLELF